MQNFQRIAGLVLLLFVATAVPSQQVDTTKAIPLVLEKDEGEQRVTRGWPGHPEPGETFILKVDPKNGGSSHMVLMTAEFAPGKEIPIHKHPDADEILFLQSGTARVNVGGLERVAHAGATVFIPAGTWVSLANIGNDKASVVAIFSAPGFDEFMRDVSVLKGQPNIPMSEAENDAAEKKHAHIVVYQ